jgi:hypothetical protein
LLKTEVKVTFNESKEARWNTDDTVNGNERDQFGTELLGMR